MSATAERNAVKAYYGRNSQFARRLDTMSDSQVIAIYYRLKSKGFVK